ncbi:MAG: S-layer homology domain-containing protein, partial [Clostridia bacterium]|nr:S-layer homology domain-containing protein [Clostridia bacterium]
MVKKIISLLLIGVMVMPFTASAEELSAETVKINFVDVAEGSAAYEAVSYLYEQGVINGKSETHFAPDDSLKREEFAKILVNAFDVAQAEAKTIFYDVPVGIWYAPFVSAISASGLMQGISESEFGSGKELTRQDLAVILKRFLDKEGVTLSGGSAVSYADNNEIAAYAKDAVEALCAQGIMDARENNLWKPAAYATRGETAIAVYNAINVKNTYYDSLGRMAPVEQYNGPYDVSTDDRIAELTPKPFDVDNMPQLELAYEDFEDSEYGNLTPPTLGEAAAYDNENAYEGNGCIKLTKAGSASFRYKTEPGFLQPGDWLVFTAMVKGENISGNGNYRNLITIYDENNKWITEAGTHIKESTDWTEHQQLIMVKADANQTVYPEYYNISLAAYMNNMTGTCYFDNIKLSKVIFPPMDTVLMTPNYKGIIKGEGGVGDIALRAYISDSNGYYNLDDFTILSRIVDKEKNVLMETQCNTVTSVMDFYFSSDELPMGGDFYLETVLCWKETGQ